MHVAIDIGAFKTRIYSSQNDGTVVCDESGKRDFSTVIALTRPRKYGSAVYSESVGEILLRKRGFFQDLRKAEAQKQLFMYFEYLGQKVLRGINHDYAVLTIPEYFDECDRTILHGIASMSSLKVGGFLTHLTGSAGCLAFRNRDCPERFAIFDFGYRKCSAGLFKFSNGRLVPLYRRVVRVGAHEFDEVIIKILIKKYGLEDTIITRERILSIVFNFKNGFTDLEKVSAKLLNDNFDYTNVEITREEFMNAAAEPISAIEAFVRDVFEDIQAINNSEEDKGNENLHIEVVGNNSYFCVIKKIMEQVNYKMTLNSNDSAAYGACLVFGVNNLPVNYKADEMIGSTFTFRVVNDSNSKTSDEGASGFEDNEEAKKDEQQHGESGDDGKNENDDKDNQNDNKDQTEYKVKAPKCAVTLNEGKAKIATIFKDNDLRGNLVVVKYSRCSPFTVDVCENGVKFATIKVLKDVTKSPETVRVTATVNDFGMLEVVRVTCNDKEIPFEYVNTHRLSEETLESIKRDHRDYTVFEDEVERFNKLRADNEMFVDSFCPSFNRLYPGVLTAEERDTIEDIVNQYFMNRTTTYEEEIQQKITILEKLSFINKKLISFEDEIRRRVDAVLKTIDPYVLPSCHNKRALRFHGLKKFFQDVIRDFSLTVENCLKFDFNEFSRFETEAYALVKEEEEEAIRIKEENERKEKERIEREEKERIEKEEKERIEKEEKEDKEDKEDKNKKDNENKVVDKVAASTAEEKEYGAGKGASAKKEQDKTNKTKDNFRKSSKFKQS